MTDPGYNSGMKKTALTQAFPKCLLLISVILIGYFVLHYQYMSTILQDMLNQQATTHVKMLAEGSIDDMLSKDYGDMEEWVKATASAEEYAFAYILSKEGKILLHSDLGYAGVLREAINVRKTISHNINYNDQPAIEIIHPIIIENTLLGSAHLAYYTRYRDKVMTENLQNMILMYAGFCLILLISIFTFIKISSRES